MSIAEFLTTEIGKAVVHPFGDKKIQRGIILYSQDEDAYYVYLPFSKENNLVELKKQKPELVPMLGVSQTVAENTLDDMEICTKGEEYSIERCGIKLKDIEQLSSSVKPAYDGTSLFYRDTEIYCGWVSSFDKHVYLKPFEEAYIDIEQMVQDGVYWVVKDAYDCGENPYFDKDGELITIPEAIDDLLPIAEEEARDDIWNRDFQKTFGDRWFKKIKFIAPETDPNFEPAKTKQFGLSPAQVYFMKCAHEYYLAHVIMNNSKKTFKALQTSQYDRDLIFDLQRKEQYRLGEDLSFSEIRHFAIESVAVEIFKLPPL